MFRSKRGAFKPLFVSKKDVAGSICMMLLALLVYGNIYRITPITASALPVQDIAKTASITPTTPVATDTSAETTPTIEIQAPVTISATVRPLPKTQSCTVAAPYSAPATLSLDSSSPTLTTVIDPTGHYQVYGSSLSQLRSNVQSCKYRVAVAGNYHAITARQINWSYGTSQNGDVCTLVGLHFGLHIAQLLPTFSPDASTPASVAAAWNTYATNLATHENGHVAIATQHVNQLIAQLQAMGPMPCSQLKSQVELTIASELAILNTEDALYDARTNHGATQGAVL